MARSEDHSSAHFDWLVDGRSRNQKCTALLYRLIEDHTAILEAEVALQRVAQDLTSIAFSLWRAVFLSDLTGQMGDQLADSKRFLRSLIAHNAVLYQTDYNSREWAFKYYLDNALFRLKRVASMTDPVILAITDIDRPAETSKDDWTNAQTALETAIANLTQVMASHDRR